MGERELRKVPVSELELHPRCQGRETLTRDAIDEYAEAYEAGVTLPPPSVFECDGRLLVVDGFHRTAAAVKASVTWLRVEVVGEGDIDDAAWAAAAANRTHGVRRTNADKRRAVRMALECGIGLESSNRVVAEHCGVHHATVARVRQEVEAALRQVDKVSTSRVGADGKRYPVSGGGSPQVGNFPTSERGDVRRDGPLQRATGAAGSSGDPLADVASLGGDDPGAALDAPATREPMPEVLALYERAARLIGKARREAIEGIEDTGLAQKVERLLRSAESTLRLSVPVVCPACAGEGCARCRRRGWMRKGDAA